MMLASRIIHIYRVFLYTPFQRIELYHYGQTGRVSHVDIEEISLFIVVLICSVTASKTAVTNTYHKSNQGKITNEFS